MRKIPTLFVRDFDSRPAYVTETVDPRCAWVADGDGVATRKYDGVCTMLDDTATPDDWETGRWWARREIKPGKSAPPNFVLVEEDPETGKQVGWEPIEQSGFAKWHAEALFHERMTGRGSRAKAWEPGTYELLGPRINGNPENVEVHWLLRHAAAAQPLDVPRDYHGLAEWLPKSGFEGIVFHHPDGRMAKIKARDFRP